MAGAGLYLWFPRSGYFVVGQAPGLRRPPRPPANALLIPEGGLGGPTKLSGIWLRDCATNEGKWHWSVEGL
jgi:hypothetical protein